MTESVTAADRLRRAVAYAITGSEPSLPAGTGPSFDPVTLITDLGGVDELRKIATEVRAAGQAWPLPIPERLRDGLGAAQLYAAVQSVRSVIDEPRPAVLRPGAPTADDLRLLRDVPPHHGG